jgi:hypothetical protein
MSTRESTSSTSQVCSPATTQSRDDMQTRQSLDDFIYFIPASYVKLQI